ncbi:MAG: DNA primase [Anaerolineales bacterium]|nr:DNA primase [Anaerolineales bacterium]
MNPVEEIKSRLDIVEVISKYVELRRAGRNYKAICPFHQEKTPSFVVFPETQTWRCFGACAEGGDVYSFLMKRQGWDFAETLKNLAEQTGVQLRPRTPEQEQKQEAYSRLFELLNTATLYFMHLLQNAPEAEPVRAYVAERGILPHIMEQFQLGYALDNWDGARVYLHGKGYQDDEMIAAGLLIQKEDTGRIYDRFRNRLIIPIRDLRGRVVGFGARALKPEDHPKYLNSPQTELFDKSSLLYGLDSAKKGIREAGQAIIVEGYMDVMQGHQAGFTNILAQMGTALTEAQIKQLKRYTNRLVLALDADAAGQKATLRGLDMARQTLDREIDILFDPRGLVRHEARLNADIRIITLPTGYDPDKLIKSDPEAWSQLVDAARPVVEYIIDSIVAEIDVNDAKAKSAAVVRAAPIIRDIGNPVERDHYTQHLARKLGIDERTLAGVVSQHARKIAPQVRTRYQPPPPPNWEDESPVEQTNGGPAEKIKAQPPNPQELYCLNQLITAPIAWRQADTSLLDLGLQPISPRDFADPENRAIFACLQKMLGGKHWDNNLLHDLEESLENSLLPRLKNIQIQRTPDPGVSKEKVAGDLAYTILLIRKEEADRAKHELDAAWAEDLMSNDKAAIGEYHQQVIELKKRRLELDRALAMILNPVAGLQERKR